MNSAFPIRLPEGTFVAHFTARGLARLDWPEVVSPGKNPAHIPTTDRSLKLCYWLAQTRAALRRVLAGQRPESLPPLDLRAGTPFQQSVWKQLLKIAPGQTRHYGELAAALGRPASARAVGNACGANPIPLLIPCHRVLPAGGGLGGFSGPKAWKDKLLAIEGVGLPLAR